MAVENWFVGGFFCKLLEEILGKADVPFLMEGADQTGADLLLGRAIQLTR